MKNILLISIFLFLGACAKNTGNTDTANVPYPTVQNDPQRPGLGAPVPGTPPGYGYQFDGAGCSTGPQRYPTMDRYCEGLRNENRNNRCALNSRYDAFRNNCPGHRWQR